MGEQCQARSCSWSKTPKRCCAEAMPREFILLDDDNNIIILDFPDSTKWKSSGESRNQSKSPSQKVISIHDDDDDTHNPHQPGNSIEGAGNDLGACDSSRSSPAANLQRSPEGDDDECQVIQEKCSAYRFSKCKQTFSSKASSRNRFGLGSESESDWSDSDCSDCEILEGSSREVREQWEKASLRKKHKAGKVNISSGLPEGTSHSGPCCVANPSVGSESPEQHAQTSSFAPRNSFSGKENSSFFFATGDEKFYTAFDTAMEEDNHGNASFFNEEICQGPSLGSNLEEIDGQFDTGFCSTGRDQQCSNFKHDRDFRSNLNHQKGDMQGEYFSFSKRKQPAEMQAQHEEPSSSPESNCLHESACQTGFKESEERLAEMQVEHEGSTSPSAQNNYSQEPLCQTSFKEAEEQPQVATESLPSAAHTSNRGGEETSSVFGTVDKRVEHRKPSLSEMEPTPSTSGHIPGVDGATTERDIINDREKLKETDEYKKAAEEEWEARQLQLRVQAEEAQRLRKRKKLESMRMLEMERRQKERVQEMRETQKTDEENLNMKEEIRAEVIKSLKRLEIMCVDMASLLGGLGIPVGGGPFPSSNEVHAAYKRALLKFHPDRTSRGDIRKQVEAEEKFKLIARMKEKFLWGFYL